MARASGHALRFFLSYQGIPMLIQTRGLRTVMLALAGLAIARGAQAGSNDDALIVTASNTAANQLLVYRPDGTLLMQIPTHGQGGVTGNAGGIAQNRERLAVVNFGSGSVSVFTKDPEHACVHLESVIPTDGSPVSVAFGHEHLYVLSTTSIESHPASFFGVRAKTDGVSHLLLGDGSAAQVGVLPHQVIVTEKTGVIETINLNDNDAVCGSPTQVAANLNAPFGLATRGNDAYVTIAHANLMSLVRSDAILTEVGSGQQLAPCWLALDGPFLFSANTASQSVSRFAVYGQVITLDAQVVAKFNGNPTDISYRAGLAAVVDANTTASHLSVFEVDEDGNFNLKSAATIAGVATNGAAVIEPDAAQDY
jgi:hypothetical protein